MLTINDVSPGVFEIKVTEGFRSDDMQKLVEFSHQINDEDRSSNLVFDIADIEGFDFSAIAGELAHLPALLGMLSQMDRIAIIANQDWMRSAARIESALLPNITYEVFSRRHAEQAYRWVKGEVEHAHGDAIRIIDVGVPGIVALEIDGRMDAEGASRAIEEFALAIEKSEGVRLLMRIRDWHGFDAAALANSEIASAKLEIAKRLERYAIVGGPQWLRGAATAFGPVFGVAIRTFDLDDEAGAIAWLGS